MPKSAGLNRRRFLRGVGAALALPMLESLPGVSVARAATAVPKRLVCMGVALSLQPEAWIPEESGKGYTLSPLLEPVKDLRSDFTVISGTDHPGVTGGHKGLPAFLSGVYKPERVGQSIVVRNTETLDQYAARNIGGETRFECLQLAATAVENTQPLSWNKRGVALKTEGRAQRIFERLFVDDEDPTAADRMLKTGQSVLDVVMEDARYLTRCLSSGDQDRLDEYMTAVREVERRIERQRSWVNTPKPEVEATGVGGSSYHENLDIILELAALALETDSTRVIAVDLVENGLMIDVKGYRGNGYHAQSHHGKNPELLEELLAVERAHVQSVARFIRRLKNTSAPEGSLLDHTQVLLGSGMGNASSHSNRNLPVLLAGGGFTHGRHAAMPQGTPLCNLYVTMLQRLGIETDRFASSTGDLNGKVV